MGACATAGTAEPDQNPDSGTPPTEAGPSCGNATIDPGEQCDSTNFGGATCQSQGYAGGLLACDPATCQFDVSSCYTCGDDQVTGDEQCDGQDLGGTTCEDLGYAGGPLSCNADACTFDTSECITSETVQNHDGACDRSIGCMDDPGDGTAGNPQSLVECFNSARLTPPFRLTQMSYIISPSFPPPDSLSLEVYTWNGAGLPGARIASIPLNPATDVASGAHTITLANPVEITTADFCVGVGGSDPNDGVRIMFSDSSTVPGASWIDAVTCQLNGFTAVPDVVENIDAGNWCITATIDKVE